MDALQKSEHGEILILFSPQNGFQCPRVKFASGKCVVDAHSRRLLQRGRFGTASYPLGLSSCSTLVHNLINASDTYGFARVSRCTKGVVLRHFVASRALVLLEDVTAPSAVVNLIHGADAQRDTLDARNPVLLHVIFRRFTRIFLQRACSEFHTERKGSGREEEKRKYGCHGTR